MVILRLSQVEVERHAVLSCRCSKARSSHYVSSPAYAHWRVGSLKITSAGDDEVQMFEQLKHSLVRVREIVIRTSVSVDPH